MCLSPFSLAAAKLHYGVSPYVLETTRTLVRGLQPRSGLMFLCSFVLLFPALAAAKLRYGVSLMSLCPYVYRVSGKSQNSWDVLPPLVVAFFCLCLVVTVPLPYYKNFT